MKHYVFRWKAMPNFPVTLSRRKTEKEVWDFAIKELRPQRVKDPKEAEKVVRTRGEVIEEKT